MQPKTVPIGLALTRAAREVSRAFDEALGRAGGSLPVWLVLLNLKTGRPSNQRELARLVGIRDATLTSHLRALEEAGLVGRDRPPENRRVQRLVLTEAGDAAFGRLRDAAVAFDRRLRRAMSDEEVSLLGDLLFRLVANVTDVAAVGGEGAAR